MVRALEKAGFVAVRQRGSHVQMRKFNEEGEKITFPVPIHEGKILKAGTLKGILRLAGLTAEELAGFL